MLNLQLATAVFSPQMHGAFVNTRSLFPREFVLTSTPPTLLLFTSLFSTPSSFHRTQRNIKHQTGV